MRGVAKVETRGRVPGVGRIVVITPREVRPRHPEAAHYLLTYLLTTQ